MLFPTFGTPHHLQIGIRHEPPVGLRAVMGQHHPVGDQRHRVKGIAVAPHAVGQAGSGLHRQDPRCRRQLRDIGGMQMPRQHHLDPCRRQPRHGIGRTDQRIGFAWWPLQRVMHDQHPPP